MKITLSVSALVSAVMGVITLGLLIVTWVAPHRLWFALACTGFATAKISSTAFLSHTIGRNGAKLAQRELDAYEAGVRQLGP